MTTTELVHRAELALADAHSTGVDAWIRVAADRLHDALVRDAAGLGAPDPAAPVVGGLVRRAA